MTQDDVTDVEVIETEDSSTPSTGASQAEALMSLEELIKNHIDSIDKMREELKQHREMFEDSFNSNPTYREHNERVKEATKARASVRSEISKQPSVAIVKQKVDDLRFDMNEQSKTLSDLLQDYKDQTGATQIETRKGQMLEIVSTSKLVRRNTKPNN